MGSGEYWGTCKTSCWYSDVADVKLNGVVVKVADVKVSGLRSLVVLLRSLVGYRYLSCMFWHLCAMETIIHSS